MSARVWVPAVFVALVALLAAGLTLDPREVPSPLVGKAAPPFELPTLAAPDKTFASKERLGSVWMLNVWASWCAACRDEHPLFMQLKASGGVPIHGLNYKDQPDHAARWLDTLGDPYTRTGADRDGRVAIDWGVYGVPETFVVTKDGRIAHKHIGPLTSKDIEATILPLVRSLRQQ